MGDVADDVIEGLACSWCGVYFEAYHGYPVLCNDCSRTSTKKERAGLQKQSRRNLYKEVGS